MPQLQIQVKNKNRFLVEVVVEGENGKGLDMSNREPQQGVVLVLKPHEYFEVARLENI